MKLSPAQRNVLSAAVRRSDTLPPLPLNTHKLQQTGAALRERGLLDTQNRPTAEGRAVFTEVRRPGIEAVCKRLRAEQPNLSEQEVLVRAKHLYTNKGVQC